MPADGQLVSFPVSDDKQRERVAEFASLRVLIGQGRTLAAAPRGTRLKKRQKSNALWVVYGAIALTADNALVLATLNLGTAFDSQLTTPGDDPAAGITSELLRLLSPATLLRDVVAQLEATEAWNRIAARLGAAPMPPEQERVFADIKQAEKGRGRPPIPDNELIAIAISYAALFARGVRHPHADLAAEFNLSEGQIRDRIYKARDRGYLAKTQRGRASGRLGPKLTAAKSDNDPPSQKAQSKTQKPG